MSLLMDRLNRMKKSESVRKPSFDQDPFQDEWKALGTELVTNEWGVFVKRRCCHPLTFQHGCYQLGELNEDAQLLSAFHPDDQVTLEQLLFFDTETTGLGVGAGNIPFMIGIGFYDKDQFVTEQCFMRNPAEERAMLHYFTELLSRFSHLVTFNGRTFDWPIIKSRYVMNRMTFKEGTFRHLDLLYASRSFWRNTLSSCRLGKVEEERLGFKRIDDVPGSLAPMLYFQFIAEGNPSILQGVFIHNEHDILSLATLAIHFERALSGKLCYDKMESEELYRIGMWLDKMGKSELAEVAIAHLLAKPIKQSINYRIALAAFYKHKGDELAAVLLWREVVESDYGTSEWTSTEPYIELAMYYEHRIKDFTAALFYADKAHQIAWKQASLLRSSLSTSTTKQRSLCDQLKKRIERLRTKCFRQGLKVNTTTVHSRIDRHASIGTG